MNDYKTNKIYGQLIYKLSTKLSNLYSKYFKFNNIDIIKMSYISQIKLHEKLDIYRIAIGFIKNKIKWDIKKE